MTRIQKQMNNKKISRKAFLSSASLVLMAVMVYLWERMIRRMEASRVSRKEIRGINNLKEGVTFFEGFYLYSDNKITRAFSSTCTHAGCLLTKEENGLILCPCHGSGFEASTGRVKKGPALKPLKPLICRIDQQSNEWIVLLSE
ncbi:MAG: Rieske (2Fe-2S) protein [Bacteroidales bacterium]|nr:Rieske (2Fe-2S) protein [Bacteroidales bacterium]